MASLNKVMIIGRLGGDPQLVYMPNGAPVATMNIATDESYQKDGQKIELVEWHRVQAWNKLGELCAKYLNKGRLIYVEGKLRTRKWKDKQGRDRYSTEIVAQKVQFLEKRKDNQNAGMGDADSGSDADDAPF